MPTVKIAIDGQPLLEIDVEIYVGQCLNAEIPASWHPEARKAERRHQELRPGQDGRAGLAVIDDFSLPIWVFTRDKETGETLYQEDGKPSGISVKMVTGLSWGAIRQLDSHRLDADAEREAIRAEMAGLKTAQEALEERLDELASTR